MKREKQLFLDDIKSEIEVQPTFIIAQYEKLTANKANDFRRKMAQAGVQFEVMRKRLFLKACQKAGIDVVIDMLPGHIGVLYATQDPIDATKAVIKYSDENEKCLKLVAARFEGKMITQQQIVELSKIPSKDQLRAQFLGLLEAPMAQTLAVIEALLSSVVYCVDNKVKQEQEQDQGQ